jgi:hypothetical protein
MLKFERSCRNERTPATPLLVPYYCRGVVEETAVRRPGLPWFIESGGHGHELSPVGDDLLAR